MKIKILFVFLILTSLASAQSGIGFRPDLEVTFDTGKYTISREQQKMIKAFSLRQNTKYGIGVIGFSDTTGTSQMNDTLSIRRARALRDCIHKYSPDLKINTILGKKDITHLNLPPERQRRAFVIIGLVCAELEDLLKSCNDDICAIAEYFVPKEKDSIIRNPEIVVKTYTTAKEKISAGINAVDTENNILKVVGVAEICIDKNWIAWHGYDVFVHIPDKKDSELKVYTKKDTLWQATNIPVKFFRNQYTTYYNFKVPDETGCFSFCLGKPAKIKRQKNGDIQANSYKTVYISTYKPFNFKDVNVAGRQNSLSYSAKLNDTLMAFTLPAYLSAKQMIFNGFYDDNGTEKPLTVSLAKCTYSKDKDGNDHYLITEESLMDKAPAKKKKGFWQWLKDLF